MQKRRYFLLLVLMAITLLFSSCAVVKPYERGTLADPIMIFDYDELDSAYCAKMYETREGATGGYGAAGGGCGCK